MDQSINENKKKIVYRFLQCLERQRLTINSNN